jgi:hypothetical protein
MYIPNIIISTKDYKKHELSIELEYFKMSEDDRKNTPKGYAITTLYALRNYNPVKFMGADFILLSTLEPYISVHYKALIKWLDKNKVRYTVNY